jgi:hypothetical protein
MKLIGTQATLRMQGRCSKMAASDVNEEKTRRGKEALTVGCNVCEDTENLKVCCHFCVYAHANQQSLNSTDCGAVNCIGTTQIYVASCQK